MFCVKVNTQSHRLLFLTVSGTQTPGVQSVKLNRQLYLHTAGSRVRLGRPEKEKKEKKEPN